jgi:bifunctional NMN adenylyltransferase/nudix hydrolase
MRIIKHSMADYCDVEKDLFITAVPDSTYNMDAWVAAVSSKVNSVIDLSHLVDPGHPEDPTVSLIGHHKDSSSFYLDHFPQWELIEVERLEGGLDATSIRELMYSTGANNLLDIKYEDEFMLAVRDQMPTPAASYLFKAVQRDMQRFLDQKEEYNFCQNYQKSYEALPYPVSFNTADALVICKSHILVIKRGRQPGKGLYAMPGGFLDRGETLQQCAIRELKEETNIDLSKHFLKRSLVGNTNGHPFDHPFRDPRGRFVTHVFHFNLEGHATLPSIEAADDASEAIWMPLSELSHNQSNFFIDHWAIIKKIANV